MRINLIEMLKEKIIGEYLISVDDIGVNGVVMDVVPYSKRESVLLEKYASSGIKLNLQDTPDTPNSKGRSVWISWNRLSKFEFNIKGENKK